MILFSVTLHWVPTSGYIPIAYGVLPWLSALIQPAAALALFETRLILPTAPGAVAGTAAAASPAPVAARDDSLLALLAAIATDPTVPEPIRHAATRDVLPLYATLFGRP